MSFITSQFCLRKTQVGGEGSSGRCNCWETAAAGVSCGSLSFVQISQMLLRVGFGRVHVSSMHVSQGLGAMIPNVQEHTKSTYLLLIPRFRVSENFSDCIHEILNE